METVPMRRLFTPVVTLHAVDTKVPALTNLVTEPRRGQVTAARALATTECLP